MDYIIFTLSFEILLQIDDFAIVCKKQLNELCFKNISPLQNC